MSNRHRYQRNPAGRRDSPRLTLRERYKAAHRAESSSPILTIILILAAFTGLFVCAIVVIIGIRLLFT
jgi:hypothetical protein